jgi:hypothetical protein
MLGRVKGWVLAVLAMLAPIGCAVRGCGRLRSRLCPKEGQAAPDPSCAPRRGGTCRDEGRPASINPTPPARAEQRASLRCLGAFAVRWIGSIVGDETGTVDGLLFLSIFAWLGREGHDSPLLSWLSGLCCAPWPFRWLIALCRAGPGSGMGCPRPWQPERLDALKAAKLTQTGTCQRVSINRADPWLSTGKVIHSVKF